MTDEKRDTYSGILGPSGDIIESTRPPSPEAGDDEPNRPDRTRWDTVGLWGVALTAGGLVIGALAYCSNNRNARESLEVDQKAIELSEAALEREAADRKLSLEVDRKAVELSEAALEREAADRELRLARLHEQAWESLGGSPLAVEIEEYTQDATQILQAEQLIFEAEELGGKTSKTLTLRCHRMLAADRDQEALDAIRLAVEMSPDDAVAHLQYGTTLLRLDFVAEALEQYDFVAESWSEMAAAHYHRGNALRRLERDEDAVAAFRRAIELEPRHWKALNNLGATFSRIGRHEDALEQFERLKSSDFAPNAVYFTNMALSLYSEDRHEEALVAAQRAIELEPDLGYGHYAAGLATSALGRLDEAERQYAQAVAIDPSISSAHFSHGVTLRQLGREEDALEAYASCIEGDPEDFKAYTNRANLLRDMDRLDEAMDAYERAVTLGPEDGLAHFGKGLTHNRLGQFEDALYHYDRSIELEPTFAAAHAARIEPLQKLGLDAEVQEALRTLAGMDRVIPADQLAQHRLAFPPPGR